MVCLNLKDFDHYAIAVSPLFVQVATLHPAPVEKWKKWNGLIASGMVHLHHAVSHIKQFGFFPCAGLLTLPSLEFRPQMQRVWFPELLDTSNFFVVRPTSNIKHI